MNNAGQFNRILEWLDGLGMCMGPNHLEHRQTKRRYKFLIMGWQMSSKNVVEVEVVCETLRIEIEMRIKASLAKKQLSYDLFSQHHVDGRQATAINTQHFFVQNHRHRCTTFIHHRHLSCQY